MKHIKKIVVATVLVAASPLAIAHPGSESHDVLLKICENHADYGDPCPCDYYFSSDRECGDAAASKRPGGPDILCHPKDVSGGTGARLSPDGILVVVEGCKTLSSAAGQNEERPSAEEERDDTERQRLAPG